MATIESMRVGLQIVRLFAVHNREPARYDAAKNQVMQKIFTVALLLFCVANASAKGCDQSAALDVLDEMREFAKAHIEGDHLVVYWTYKIEKKSTTERLKAVTTYANMDACLSGGAREIHFYRKNKIMGIVSPANGIKLID
jgi:hypothetical protein